MYIYSKGVWNYMPILPGPSHEKVDQVDLKGIKN